MTRTEPTTSPPTRTRKLLIEVDLSDPRNEHPDVLGALLRRFSNSVVGGSTPVALKDGQGETRLRTRWVEDRHEDRVLVVSTAHVTKAEADQFGGGGHPLLAYLSWEYGWQVHVDPLGVDCDPPEASQGMLDVFRAARDRGCTWVRFDQDAPLLDGAEHYTW